MRRSRSSMLADDNFLKSEAKARYYLPVLQDTGIRTSLPHGWYVERL